MLEATRSTKPFRLERWECSELQIHVGVVDAMRKFGRTDCVWFHPANGEARSIQAGRRLKAMGTRAGVSDLVFIRDGAPVLFLEIKTSRGIQSQSQRAFEAQAIAAGAQYAIVRSLDEALSVLCERGYLSRTLV